MTKSTRELHMRSTRSHRDAGERIGYAHAACKLGPLFVAATDRGLCAVEFLTAEEGQTQLLRRFPHAHIEAGDAQLRGWVKQLVALMNNGAKPSKLPLDIRGTAFQTQVWKALQRIAPGTTISYGELAAQLGRPQAVRAVARACGSNRVAVLVPCHRVIGRDGSLTGYHWGLERKRALLAREASAKSKGRQPAPAMR
ncbi:MAG: methylated-DNA--[protein]-cysteine S-methyltransferase [Nevskiaceae bacterium]|jgi:AraC family transcriptional regulator of adaptative response/methylated-DNA-[protein]-cysteine methyltransferase|nr:methylated-DNA--[protein]-cysteine S-methyltransferase [Nevskiaceae bacterium]